MGRDRSLTRRELLGAGVAVGTLAVAGCTTPDPGPPEGSSRIHHLDVGQADATLIETPDDETVVVDTGGWQQEGQGIIDHLEFLGIEHVDHLVATHAHADHIGGHADLIEHFETERDGIGFVYDSGLTHTTAAYQDYIDAVDEYGHDLLVVEEDEFLPVDGIDVFVLNPPTNGGGDDLDYNCVVLRVDHDEVTYLTTGDAGADAEARMVSDWGGQLPADIYQAGHHGSSTSSTEPFLDAVDPETSVISSAYDSQFGHPDDEVLSRYGDFGIETYWTGVHGEAVMTIDGQSVTTDTDESFSTDPLDILAAKPDAAGGRVGTGTGESSGTITAVVDRIESGVAVLLLESTGDVAGRSVLPVGRLPQGAGEGTVLSVTIDEGAIRVLTTDTQATQQRVQAVQARVEDLSTPLSSVR